MRSMFKDNLFIIAELSANHNNDLDLAVKTIESIAKSGADAVKVQTFTADSLTLDVDNEYFGPRKEGLWKGRTLYDLYTEGALPYEWHETLKKAANKNGLLFFSSPFAKKDVDFLETLDVTMYKIASFEITDIPLIEYVASKNKPVIISTGIADIEDIQLALETCRKVGNNDITLLKCTSEYPSTPEMANLITISDLKDRFKVKVGLSDHTMGITVPVAAVALGATVIEKHFILNRDMGGIDSAFSMEPKEFAEMVKSCKQAYSALGNISYETTNRNCLRRRSLFVAEEIKKGDIITENNVRSVRPGNGLHPKYLSEIIGKKANRNLRIGQPFFLEFINEQ